MGMRLLLPSGTPASWLSAPAMALTGSSCRPGAGVRRLTGWRPLGSGVGGGGAGREVGTWIAPDLLPGIRRGASKSWLLLPDQPDRPEPEPPSSGSGAAAAAAIGGGVEARRRRRSSAAEID